MEFYKTDYKESKEPLLLNDNIKNNYSKINDFKQNNTASKANKKLKINIDNYFSTFKQIILTSIPVILSLVFSFLPQTTNIIYTGYYFNSETQAAVGLATIYINCTGFLFGIGLLGVMDTLCSQAYGARQYKTLNFFYRLSNVIVILFFIMFVIPLSFFFNNLISYFINEENIIEIGFTYISYCSISVLFFLLFHVNLRYMQSIGVYYPGMVITILTGIKHVFACIYLDEWFDDKIKLYACALTLTSILNLISSSIYINYFVSFPEAELIYEKTLLKNTKNKYYCNTNYDNIPKITNIEMNFGNDEELYNNDTYENCNYNNTTTVNDESSLLQSSRYHFLNNLPFNKRIQYYINEYYKCFSLSHIINYIKIGLPSAIIFSGDWIGYEILIIFAAQIGKSELITSICFYNLAMLLTFIPIGISYTVAILVGNKIGGKLVSEAKFFTFIGIMLNLIIVLCTGFVLNHFSSQLVDLYSEIYESRDIFSELLPYVLIFFVINSCQIVLGGSIKGLGMQKPGALVLLMIIYPIGIQTAKMFTQEFDYGLMGIWYSQITSALLLTFSYIILICSLDWYIISTRAIANCGVINKALINKEESMNN